MRGLAMIDGCVRLTTRFAVGQRNRTAMEETAIFLGAFSDSKPHTRLFTADGPQPRRIETFRRRVRGGLGFRRVGLTRAVWGVRGRPGRISAKCPFAVTLSTARGTLGRFGWAGTGLQKISHLAPAKRQPR